MTMYSTNEPGGWILHPVPMMLAQSRQRLFLGLTRLLTHPEKATGVDRKYVFLPHQYSLSRVPEPILGDRTRSLARQSRSLQWQPLFGVLYPCPPTKAPWNRSSCCSSHRSPLINMDAR